MADMLVMKTRMMLLSRMKGDHSPHSQTITCVWGGGRIHKLGRVLACPLVPDVMVYPWKVGASGQ